MNRDEAIQRAEALLFQVRGDAEYQWRNSQWRDEWFDFTNPLIPSEASTFMSDAVEIRIKPKPLEWWSFVSKANRPVTTIIADEQPLSTPEGWAALGGRWVRMREVE